MKTKALSIIGILSLLCALCLLASCGGNSTTDKPNASPTIGGESTPAESEDTCNHIVVTDPAIEPTCTKTGLTEGSHCSVCNEVLTAQQEVAEKGHTWENRVCKDCNAVDASEGLKYVLDGDSYMVTDIGACEDVDIIIPKTYKDKPVAAIADNAFKNYAYLKSIKIPDSVTSIGERAFDGCSNLTSVTIDNGVTSIGYYVFSGCTGLTSIVIPDSVESIGQYAFFGCTGLTSITIPDSVTSIGKYAFYGCSGLTSIVIPDKVESIGQYAFSYCTGLTSITVSPDNPVYYSEGNCIITKEGNELIVGCNSSIIPSGVTSIGDSAFRGCSGLTSIVIPDSVTSIGEYAFRECVKLVEVINHSKLTITASSTSNGYVGYYAKEVHTGSSKIVNMDGYLFYTYDGTNYLLGYTGSKTDLILPEDYNGQKYEIYQSAFSNCKGLTSTVIPDSVTSIGAYAFKGCSGLTSVTIGNGVKSIGAYAFYGCSGLTDIWCEAASKPAGWDSDWNKYCSATVHWGIEWEYVDGVPTLK